MSFPNIPIQCYETEILGCTYPSASNYNPLATIDDGSCIPYSIFFDVNLFATHLQVCTLPSNPSDADVGFVLNLGGITTNGSFSVIRTFIKLYAYADTKFTTRVDCNNAFTKYINRPTVLQGNQNRLANGKFNVVEFPSILGGAEVLAFRKSDSNYNDITRKLPVQITIWADGQIFTKNDSIYIYSYFDSFTPSTEIIRIQ